MLLDPRIARRHTVVVLVGGVDRRIVPALRFVCRVPHTDARAVHVSVDADDTRRLAREWMDLGLSWLPLHIRDAGPDGLLASTRRIVQQEAGGRRNVTVVIPELVHPRWWLPLLHRRTARRIAHHLQSLPGVTTVILPFSTSARADRAYENAGRRYN